MAFGPEWEAWRAEYRDPTGDTPDARLLRRLEAIREMERIEAAAERAP